VSGFANTLIGMTLGGYTIRRLIARGGMGIVYEGVQESLGRRVAVKVLYPHLGEDESFRERFQREARAIAHLRHQNIVGVIDFGSDHGYLFMVMELIDGLSLRDELARRHEQGRPFSTDESLTILRSIASALTYAHGRGMIHRDVKPANVMLDQDGDVYLTDFGLVKLADAQNVTIAGMIVGTPEYMAPEQSAGPVDVTPAVDQYSLAVVAYQLLVGRVPFTAPTPVGVIQKHISEPPPPPHTIVPTFPPHVERVLMRGLSKEPEDRYPTVDVFIRELSLAARSSLQGVAPVQDVVDDTYSSTPVDVTIVEPDDPASVAQPTAPVRPRHPGADLDTMRVPHAETAPTAAPSAGFPSSAAPVNTSSSPTIASPAAPSGAGGYQPPPPNAAPYGAVPERGRNPLVVAAVAAGLALIVGCVGAVAFVLGGGDLRGSAESATSTPFGVAVATSAGVETAVPAVESTPTQANASTATNPAATASQNPTATPAGQAPTATTVAATPTEAPTPTATTVVVRIPSPSPTRIVIDPVTPTPSSGSGVEGWDLLADETFEDGTQFYTGETAAGVVAFVRDGWYGVDMPQNRWQMFPASWLEGMSEGFIGTRVHFSGQGFAGVVARSWSASDEDYSFHVCWLGSAGSAGCSYVANNEWTALYSIASRMGRLRWLRRTRCRYRSTARS
jgi:serine/threonine protein kinase